MSEKILIVDDEPALQETVAYNLRKQGYEVWIAGDGPSGLDHGAKRVPGFDRVRPDAAGYGWAGSVPDLAAGK